jgi:hypothetical protein
VGNYDTTTITITILSHSFPHGGISTWTHSRTVPYPIGSSLRGLEVLSQYFFTLRTNQTYGPERIHVDTIGRIQLDRDGCV